MQLSPKKSIDEGFILSRDRTKINELEFNKYYNSSSVDLTIRDILVKDNKDKIRCVSSYKIKPQETVYLISEQIIRVKPGYVAYVFLKNRVSQNGILALNTGIVDGGYDGPISTIVTNFSNAEVSLSAELFTSDNSPEPFTDSSEEQTNYSDKFSLNYLYKILQGSTSSETIEKNTYKSFFRVVFHQIELSTEEKKEIENNSKPKGYQEYLRYRKEEFENLPKLFLDPDKLKESINKEISEKAIDIRYSKMALILAALSILFAFMFSLLPLLSNIVSDNYLHSKIKNSTYSLLEERIKLLEKSVISKNLKSNSIVILAELTNRLEKIKHDIDIMKSSMSVIDKKIELSILRKHEIITEIDTTLTKFNSLKTEFREPSKYNDYYKKAHLNNKTISIKLSEFEAKIKNIQITLDSIISSTN